MGGLEAHGQGPQAALGGPLEGLAVLQQDPVEVQADVRLETLWETFQDLRGRDGPPEPPDPSRKTLWLCG